jgi:hypothetical protein
MIYDLFDCCLIDKVKIDRKSDKSAYFRALLMINLFDCCLIDRVDLDEKS